MALAVALRILRDRLEAEDVLQDAFVASVGLRQTFDPRRGSELSWLLAIVKGKALDRLRSQKVRTSAADVLRQAPRADAREADPMAEAYMKRALSTLSAQQQTALNLAYFEGLTHVEIATRMGTPLGTVKSWLRAGIAQLGAAVNAPATPQTGLEEPGTARNHSELERLRA
jgi:RNA polymerase sigma-70 factor (ECF subfamily)